MANKRTVSVLSIVALALASATPAQAIGGQIGLEFAIDAPWRIEPVVLSDGRNSYGPIPISVTFQDAVFEQARGWLGSKAFEQIVVGRLKEIRISEMGAAGAEGVTVIAPSQLAEIERKSRVSTITREPPHELCRPSPGQDCAELLEISNSHEWHTGFWFTPKRPMAPGLRLQLQVTVVTTLAPIGTPPAQASRAERSWTNRLIVVAGERPLPRFGDAWLYGDLHYHSQMTDNEGETGYSYRNVVRAMGAMGLDFVFATDHASNGQQIDGGIAGEVCADSPIPSFLAGCKEARDLNPQRFAAAKTILYGPDGANEAIGREASRLARVKSANILPQIYMGEELDAVPEMSAAERNAGAITYGDGQLYHYADVNDCVTKPFTSPLFPLPPCIERYSLPYIEGDRISYWVLDQQGIPVPRVVNDAVENRVLRTIGKIFGNAAVDDELKAKPRPSRQHLVYFPSSGLPNGQGWIASDTNIFGGASKALEVVTREIERNGYAFLAHPLLSLHPGRSIADDIAPAEAPYSAIALTRAWRSPSILGLEFWNENDVLSTPSYHGDAIREELTGLFTPKNYTYLYPWAKDVFPWRWLLNKEEVKNEFDGRSGRAGQLYHGAFTWDRFLRKGLDPQQTASLAWLPRGEPRKWFMSGGSDSHGDLNFRRYGRPYCDGGTGRWCDKPVTDTAIGNPRNLVDLTPAGSGVSAGAATDRTNPGNGPKRYTNTQVLDALKAGKFSVTDGPALRLAIDRNRNGAIDPTDFQMGSTTDFFPGEHIPLLIEWISTPEFGPVTQVDLYIGNKTTTYAPESAFSYRGPGSNVIDTYARDPSGVLQIKVATIEAGYRGLARIYVGPEQFGLVAGDQALSYVRAVAKTISAVDGYARTDVVGGQQRRLCPAPLTGGSKCGDRLAYTNPVWTRYRVTCPTARSPAGGGTTAVGQRPGSFLDSDANSVPDTCERNVPDPCQTTSGGARGRLATETGVGRQPPPPVSRDPDRAPVGPVAAKAVPTKSCTVFTG